jgi:hypothetical protein
MTLKSAATVFLVGFLLHNADHARRGIDAITDHVVWGGTIVAMVAAVVLTLVFTDHPAAPMAAAAAGLGIAVGVSATHLLPEWGVLSDPLLDLSATSWVAVFAEIAGAVLLGVSGLRAGTLPSRHRPGRTTRSTARPS